MAGRVPVAQLRHCQLTAFRRGAGPFQLSRRESRILQFFELCQNLVGAVELASFKSSFYRTFDLGDFRRVIRVGRNGFAEACVAKSLDGWTYPFEPAGVQ
jgi:hypothetical protein